MKAKHLFGLIIIIFSVIGTGCKKGKNISVRLYISEPITAANDSLMPKEILKLIEPIECQNKQNGIIKLTVYRYDHDPMKSEVIEIPYTGANKMRKNLNMISYKHYKKEFNDNSATFPNYKIFYEPVGNVSLEKQAEAEAAIMNSPQSTFLCCGEDLFFNNNQAITYSENFNKLVSSLKDSICSTKEVVSYKIIYHKVAGSEPPVIEASNTVERNQQTQQNSSAEIKVEEIFNTIGDMNVDPNERIELVPKYLSSFAENAYVKVIGTNGTSFEPEPIKDYLKKIAFFRSLKKIEIIEALKNNNGEYWEIRLKEHHVNIDQ